MKPQALDKKVNYFASEQAYNYNPYIPCQKDSETSRKTLVAHWFTDDDGRLFCKWFTE